MNSKSMVANNPKQELAVKYYTDPSSATFGNRRQSLLKAGFSPNTALQGSAFAWLTTPRDEQTVKLIQKAEDNLRRLIEINVKLNSDSNKTDIEIAKLQADVSKFVVKSLAGKKWQPDEKAQAPEIQINIVNYGDQSSGSQAVDTIRDAEVVDAKDGDQ